MKAQHEINIDFMQNNYIFLLSLNNKWVTKHILSVLLNYVFFPPMCNNDYILFVTVGHEALEEQVLKYAVVKKTQQWVRVWNGNMTAVNSEHWVLCSDPLQLLGLQFVSCQTRTTRHQCRTWRWTTFCSVCWISWVSTWLLIEQIEENAWNEKMGMRWIHLLCSLKKINGANNRFYTGFNFKLA